ncbi:MAG TPA: EF-hand domain-containing protein [Ideonella sp.]|nr:EF-hand domain-containing protein [Ideonella sp.]
MHKITTACLLATLTALSLGASAAAQRAGNERIAALDTNGDQYISREEAAANPKLSSNFDAIDTDRDGKLSSSELKTYAKAHRADAGSKGAGKLDTNGDGLLTREEAASSKKLMRNFDMIDTNKDGRLSADELKAAKAAGKSAPGPMPVPPASAT